MECIQYGVGVNNRYELFVDDESDPLEAINRIEKEKPKKAKPAAEEPKPKTPAPAQKKPAKQPSPQEAKPNSQKQPIAPKGNNNDQVQEKNERNTKRNASNAASGEQKFARSGNDQRSRNGEPRRDFRGRAGDQRPIDQSDDKPRAYSPRGGNRNGGGGGGAGRGGAPRRSFDDRRGKREFDRQSGSDKTGVKSVEKRDGAGAHNWGTHKDVIDEAEKINDETVEKADANDSNNEETKETEAPAAPAEEEPKQLTLEEYKALKANRAKPEFKIRKAGEGEDLSQWKGMFELKKTIAAEEDENEDLEYDPSDYPQRVGKLKHVKEIQFVFNDGKRGGGGFRGGRGNRGGGRQPTRETSANGHGDENNGAFKKPGKPKAAAPKVDDERAFPSLG